MVDLFTEVDRPFFVGRRFLHLVQKRTNVVEAPVSLVSGRSLDADRVGDHVAVGSEWPVITDLAPT